MPVVAKKVSAFDFSSISNRPLTQNFETKIVEIYCKVSEIYYFEVEHSKFYKINFNDF